ncbi:MAG: hypothetical protein K6F15_05375 [Treponema sp.]|nr:hypothetical protein [Treponema sp.]
MRKPIALILDYLTVTFICVVAGIFFFTQYFNSLTLVAGKNIDFSADIIAYGLFETLPLVFLFIAMFVIFYKIRHKSSPLSSFITYSLLIAFTWFALFPLSIVMQDKVYSMLTPIEKLENKNQLSGGYFRNINGKIYYFVSDSRDDIADVFCFFDYSRPTSMVERDFIRIGNNSGFSETFGDFHDPIIKDTAPSIPYNLDEAFKTIKENAKNAWLNGIIAWLCFSSMGFALASLYCFIRISSWKLLNCYWVAFFTGLVIWFNYYYFQDAFSFVRQVLTNLFHDGGHLTFFLERQISLPLTCINLIFAIIMTSVGIIKATAKRR